MAVLHVPVSQHLAGVCQCRRAEPGLSWCQLGTSACTDWRYACGPMMWQPFVRGAFWWEGDMALQSQDRLAWEGVWKGAWAFCTECLVLLHHACIVGVTSVLRLSAGLAWGMMGALFSSKAAWRSWEGEPTAQQVSSLLQCCFATCPSVSSAGGGGWWLAWEGLLSLPGCAGFPNTCLMDRVFLPLAFQSQHLLCPERALLLRGYCATAWGNPQTAGRGWQGLETSPRPAPGLLAPSLPWAKPNLRSNGPATQDSPCACTRARQCLPCPGTAHQAQGLLAPLPCSAPTTTPAPCPALRLHEPPQAAAAPSLGGWTRASHSARSQGTQSHLTSSQPAGCSQRAWGSTASDLPCLLVLPCSSWWPLGTS